MDKKELLKKKEMLMQEIKKEKAKLNEYEKTLSLYEFKEAEMKKEEAKKAAPAKKPAPAKKKPAAKKPAAKKSAPKKVETKPAVTPAPKLEGANKKNMKKHTIVPMSVYEKYDYEQRKSDWHKYSGMNEKQIVCDACKDDDNFETVLLENGCHLCYFCWVKKPIKLEAKKQPAKPVVAPVKKEEAKPVLVKKEDPKKAEPKKTETKDVAEGNPKAFAAISITLGILLIAVIVILAIGIITSWTFGF